jgi:1,4-dihydroxy-2-naphthoate octaprenyltransferase
MISPWFLAIRPKTLFAAAAPVILGSAVAWRTGQFQLSIFILCLLGSVLLQIESNLANDYFDWKHGADTKDRLGPLRVTSSGLISPSGMKIGMVVVAALSLIVGTILISKVGWPILWIGLSGLICAFLYTAGPYPLSRIGIADLFVFIFFGPVAVAGTSYSHLGQLPLLSLFLSIPLGLVAVAILLVNNIRDFHEDKTTGKRTLVVRVGLKKSIQLYQLFMSAPILAALASGFVIGPTMYLPILTLPMNFKLLQKISKTTGRDLNAVLGMTGLYLFLTSLLFSIGMIL